MKRTSTPDGNLKGADAMTEKLQVAGKGVKVGFDTREFGEIIRASFQSDRFKDKSVPAVACTIFRENPVRYAIANLAELIHDEKSFGVFLEALCALMPDRLAETYVFPWPSKAGVGISTAKALKKDVFDECGAYAHLVEGPKELLTMFLADVLCLALIERERQLMATQNGSALLKLLDKGM